MIECSCCLRVVEDFNTQACPTCGQIVCDDCVDQDSGTCGLCNQQIIGCGNLEFEY